MHWGHIKKIFHYKWNTKENLPVWGFHSDTLILGKTKIKPSNSTSKYTFCILV